MIRKDASGKDAEIPINLFDANTGAAIEGHIWVDGEVLLALPDGVFANANVANIDEKGRGRYALQLTALETATTGMVQLDLDTTNGYLPHSMVDWILDVPTVAFVSGDAVGAGAITWQNVVDFFAEQATVPLNTQNSILAHVNTALSVSNFLNGETDVQLRLARIYLAAHFGELATPAAAGDDISSKTVSKDSLTVSYATAMSGEELAKTTGGALYLSIVNSTPARVGFVATNPGC